MYYQFERVNFLPKPVQQPLPIWIGGRGRAAFRRVARFGNGWVPMAQGAEDVAREREMLIEELEKEGRSIEAIEVGGGIAIDFGDGEGGAGLPPKPEPVLEAIET